MPQVLSHLKSCGWAVDEAKLQGPGLSDKFLGAVWSDKTKVIPDVVIGRTQAYPAPTTVKQLQTFLGLLGYWRVFVPHLARVVCPLYALVEKGASWDWTLILEQVFQRAKCIIKHAQALHALDPAGPCELDVLVTQEGSVNSWVSGPNYGREQRCGTS